MYENGEADCTVIQHSQPFFCPWNKTISDSIALFYNADFWPTTFTRNSSSNFILAFICKLYTWIRRHFLITLYFSLNSRHNKWIRFINIIFFYLSMQNFFLLLKDGWYKLAIFNFHSFEITQLLCHLTAVL